MKAVDDLQTGLGNGRRQLSRGNKTQNESPSRKKRSNEQVNS